MNRNLFESYASLWPNQLHDQLRPFLSQIEVIHMPEDAHRPSAFMRPSQTVVVATHLKTKEMIELALRGFEHFVQRDRDDFAQELLVSGLMAVRPKDFSENPIPFFFTGFQQPKTASSSTHLVQEFRGSEDKNVIIDRLHTFLGQHRGVVRLRDICLQVADEMISNACFNAPQLADGRRPFQLVDRSTHVKLPGTIPGIVFATYTDKKLVIGCQDPFGTFNRVEMLTHLRREMRDEKSTPRMGSGGAGIGLRYMIESSANFYVYGEQGRKTIVACAFKVGSLKENLLDDRHLHFSFR